MTNQEAIDIIKTAIGQVEWDYPMDYAAAFDKAIKALELLKAQEARVMTLEELKAYLLIGEDGRFMEGYGWEELAQRVPIYIEPRDPTLGTLYWWTAERLRPWVSESYFQESYGKKRRAWTSRPTDEQREKVKWNE